MIRNLIVLLLVGGISVSGATGVGSTEAPVVLQPEDLVWTDRPQGVRVAVLQGDPADEGPFTLRLQYPPGYTKGPHFHPRDAYVTVLSGSYYRAYGNTFDRSRGIALIPGTFSVNPAGISHYEWTTEAALIQVTAMGPWETVYVDSDGSPREDPE